MKSKLVMLGVIAALIPNVCAYAGESQASSAASTMNQSSAGNEQSSQATNRPQSSSTTTNTSSATTQTSTQASTLNPNQRGRVVQPTLHPSKTASQTTAARRPAKQGARTYKAGYRKAGYGARTASTVRWQTKNWK